MKKVTTWSAETEDGSYYAERETNTGQYWKLFNRMRFLGRYRGFKAVCDAVPSDVTKEPNKV